MCQAYAHMKQEIRRASAVAINLKAISDWQLPSRNLCITPNAQPANNAMHARPQTCKAANMQGRKHLKTPPAELNPASPLPDAARKNNKMCARHAKPEHCRIPPRTINQSHTGLPVRATSAVSAITAKTGRTHHAQSHAQRQPMSVTTQTNPSAPFIATHLLPRTADQRCQLFSYAELHVFAQAACLLQQGRKQVCAEHPYPSLQLRCRHAAA